MKKLILFVNLNLIVFLSFSQTNIYYPFPEGNVVWNYNYIHFCFGGHANEFYSIIIDGDTIISDSTYKKLHIPFVLSLTTGTCTSVSPGYKGAFRQDTLNRKVYFVSPSSNTELLLYDFNLQIGDTIIRPYGYAVDVVIDIDSVLVGSNYRKRWKINQGYNIYIIEGIGSTYGLIANSPGAYVDHPDYFLTCFSENNMILYPNQNNNCEIITGVETDKEKDFGVSIFPNPSAGTATLLINDSNIEVKLINIRSLLGQLLYSKHLNEAKALIDISNLNNGIYILEIITCEKTIIKKIILSR